MHHVPDGLPPVLPISIAQIRRRLPQGAHVLLGAGQRVAPGDVLARLPDGTALFAGISGYVAGVRPGRELLIETGAAMLRCPWGIGGEAYGLLRVLGERDRTLSPAAIDARSAGAIVIAGTAPAAALMRARDEGVLGIVLGSIDAGQLALFLACMPDAIADAAARYLGPPALLLSNGFGAAPMDRAAWELLQMYDRHTALLDAVDTPRLLLPLPSLPGGLAPNPPHTAQPGMQVRLVDEPHLGATGTLLAVHEQARFPSGVRCAAATVRLGDREVTVAAAAVEILML